jgi:hypothetical protein
MPRAGARDIAKEQGWRKLFADWKASGLTAAQFCRDRQIKQDLFSYWKRVIAERDAEAARSARKSRPRPEKSAAEPEPFAEVHVKDDAPPAKSARESASLEIVFKSGASIKIGSDCSLSLLASVVDVMEDRGRV